MSPERFIGERAGALICLALCIAACSRDPTDDPEYARACEGKPLASPEARQEALEAGYSINQRFDCIDRASHEEVARAHALVANMVREAEQSVNASRAAGSAFSLGAARAGFQTRLSVPSSGQMPLPQPPADLFQRSDYASSLGKLAAWVTPDPGDGQKHPTHLAHGRRYQFAR